jgi:hypothetical protein
MVAGIEEAQISAGTKVVRVPCMNSQLSFDCKNHLQEEFILDIIFKLVDTLFGFFQRFGPF